MFSTLAPILLQATWETVYMVVVSLSIATAFGLPLGVLLATSGRGELFEALWFQRVFGPIVNATRSVAVHHSGRRHYSVYPLCLSGPRLAPRRPLYR